MSNLNIYRTGTVVGIVSAVFFLICVAWGVVLTNPVIEELHLNLIQMVYPGFTMSFVGAIIGIVEAFIYGWFFGVLFAWLCRKVCVFEGHGSSR